MNVRLTKDALLLAFDLWWLFFSILVITGFNEWHVLNVVSFVSLFILPGLFAVIIFRSRMPLWINAALCVALSLLILMVVGLLANVALPLVGVVRPLENPFLLGVISIAAISLAFIAWVRVDREVVIAIPTLRVRDAALALAPLAFIGLSVIGASVLNNGGTNVFVLVLLAAIALYCATLIYLAEELHPSVIPTGLFFVALSLLLMTSLRGWFITGHDIQREFEVFQLTKGFGHWSMSYYKDAYNACLSITILPTMLANIFKMADPYIYKILYQIVFALVVPVVYLIARKILTVRLALISAMLFISFPTFFQDMPFLNRQEIAFLFFGLMLYILFDDAFFPRQRTALFSLMAGGIVLSHYATTYTIIVIFACALALAGVIRYIRPLTSRLRAQASRIKPHMLALLILMSFVWTVMVTDTGGNIMTVAAQTVAAIGSSFTENSRSADAISLVAFGKPQRFVTLDQYIAATVTPLRQSEPDAFYREDLFMQYQYRTLGEYVLPQTALGKAFSVGTINAATIAIFLGQATAKIIELSVLVGLLFILTRRAHKEVELEWFCLMIAALLFVALNVVLPVLSTEYGVFRALQQSLFIVAPLLVLGLYWIGSLWSEKVAGRFIVVMALFFFLYSSGFVPQLLGGNEPALHLNNSGFYYDKYFMHPEEIAAAQWLKTKEQDPNFEVQADRHGQQKLAALGLRSSGDIFPGLVKKNAYVFLDTTNVIKHQSSVLFGGSLLTYRYPEFIDEQKDLLYSNDGARIYK